MTISIDDIKDIGSLKAWLDDRPEAVRQNCAVFIAARSALRVLPIAVEGLQFSDWSLEHEGTAIPILRCFISSSVAAKFPAIDARDACADAAEVANRITQVAFNTGRSGCVCRSLFGS